MFVGYEIKAQLNHAKPVFLETDIKLSQAVLDPSKGSKSEPVSLMVEYDKKRFIIAVLDPSRSWQCPLDLMFSAGSQVKFFVKGNGIVHLTGFEYRDDMNSELGFDTSSDEEEEDEEDEPKEKVTEKRASKIDAKKVKTNGVSKAHGKDAKKPAGGDQVDSDDVDDDESDDEDFDSEMMDDDDLEGSDEEDEELDEDLDLDDEDEESEEEEE